MIFKFKNVVVILFVSIFFLQCTENNKYSDDTFFGSKVIVLGHRGMGQLYKMPGNSLDAIHPVIGIGANGTEVDVQLTKDSVLVLFHDNEMDLLSNCNGKIFESEWSEIKKCKYYSVENNVFVASVEELFLSVDNLQNLYFSFDCKIDHSVEKPEEYQDKFLRAIKQLFNKYNMTNNVLIEGRIHFLKRAQQLGLKNKLFFMCDLNEDNVEIAHTNNFFGVSVELSNIGEYSQLVHQKGLYLMAYSPKTFYENKKALELGADIIQTDKPISLLKILNRYNYEYIIP